MSGADPTKEALSHARTLPGGAGPDLSSGPSTAAADPQTIGRYRVLARVGAGGMGVVFAAYDNDLDRKVAIKLVAAAGADALQARLLREAQAMARLSHPNVAQVYEVGTHLGQIYIAMEFIRGCSLRQWLAAAPRGWRELLAVFAQAGRGLQAAHDAGLVHRDFKPDNVMVAEDGRAVVLDFGIAHTRADPAAPGAGDSDGALVGTPAYMSPEQWRGEHVLAASDQYNFCAALFEALHGRLPGADEPAAGTSALRPDPALARDAAAAPGRRLPARVRRAVLRGLSRDPADRFRSMDALLAELTRAPARPWRWLAAAGLALGAAAALLLGRPDPAAVCADAAAPIGAVWGPTQRIAVLKALSSEPSLRGDAPHAAGQLDAYARAWAAQARAACEATHVRREASEAHLDRRTTCLQGRLRAMRALTLELAAGPHARALEAIDALPPLSHCEDAVYLAATVAPPPPELAGPVAAVRERLATARAKASVGDLRPALSLTQEAAAAAAALDYPPLLAEAQLQLGREHRALGEGVQAEAALARAFHLSLAHGDDTTAAEAALSAANAAQIGGHRESMSTWDALAEDMLVRSGSPDHLRIALTYERGVTSCIEHRCDDAPARLETLLAAREARLGPEHPEVADLVVQIAGLWMVRDDNARAEATYRRALALRERKRGRNAAELGIILGNLAELARRAGRLDEAEAFARRALPIAERSYGVAHPFVARLLHKLADVAARRGDHATAEADIRRALAIDLDRSGLSSSTTALSLVALASLRLRAGDLDGAATHAQQVLAHPDWFNAESMTAAHEVAADIALARRRFDTAADVASRGLAAFAEASTSRLHALHTALGEARLALGDVAGARAALDQALAALESRGGRPNPEDWARARFALARALAAGDPAQAVALAGRARADLARAGPAFAARDAEIAAWLAAQHVR